MHWHSWACLDVKSSLRPDLHLCRLCCYTHEPYDDIMWKNCSCVPKNPYHTTNTPSGLFYCTQRGPQNLHLTYPQLHLGQRVHEYSYLSIRYVFGKKSSKIQVLECWRIIKLSLNNWFMDLDSQTHRPKNSLIITKASTLWAKA